MASADLQHDPSEENIENWKRELDVASGGNTQIWLVCCLLIIAITLIFIISAYIPT
jgi:hypothetical protein